LARKRQIGALSQDIPTLLRLDDCTPPPIQLTSEAAARSTGLIPAAFGTIVG